MNQIEVIATEETLGAILAEFKEEPILAIDTETTGLRPFHNDELFSIIVSSSKTACYFNFNWYSELGVAQYQLKDKASLAPLFETPRLWVLQNAKFDLHFLNKAGLKPKGEFYDTQVAGRVLYNIHDSYSLDAMAERELGERKDDAVMKWLEENKCYQMESVPGRKKQNKNYFFNQVPFEIISKYGAKDAKLTLALWQHQTDPDKNPFHATDQNVIQNEMRLIQTLFDMEQVGVKVDIPFTIAASEFERRRVEQALEKWKAAHGVELTDSGEYLKPVFEALGFYIPLTDKGEPNVDYNVISKIDHPLARILEEYRDADKRYSTLMGLLYQADNNHVVHTNFKQSGTVTGRMSSMEPNLQNLAAEDESEYPIRRAFVPRPGFFFVSIDYKQMEFRVLLDYAKEMELIQKIIEGHDPHQATADLTGLSRKAAKTLNFGLIYGMGIARLAHGIGVTDAEAKAFKQKYFNALPGVQQFLWNASGNQRKRGFTWNWFGRRFQLKDKNFAYRAPNSVIQGGCADVCKIAMNRLHGFLGDKKTRMVLQVHDEILFEVALDEVGIVPELKAIMEAAYPVRNIPLTCSVEFSLKSFHDMETVSEDLGEIYRAIGASIPSEGQESPEGTSERVVLQGERTELSGNSGLHTVH
jgi:DNA polymerase-1